jgi:hypothetical protein
MTGSELTVIKTGKVPALPGRLWFYDNFEHDRIAALFRKTAADIDPEVSGFVFEKLLEYKERHGAVSGEGQDPS